MIRNIGNLDVDCGAHVAAFEMHNQVPDVHRCLLTRGETVSLIGILQAWLTAPAITVDDEDLIG